MRLPKETLYKILVIFWFTLSISSVVLAGISWWQLTKQMSAGRELVNSKDEINIIYKLLLDTETGARGYVITGDPAFLEPYASSHTNFPAHFEHLVELVHDDPTTLQKVIDFRAQAELVLEWQKNLVAARMQNFTAAQAMTSTGDGKRIMDEMRRQADDLYRVESNQLNDLRANLSGRLLRASLTGLIAGFLGIVAGIILFWLLRLTLKHKEYEDELIEAKSQAERTNREKTIFLANMSHEIRTPMNAILGFSELLKDNLKEPKQQQYLNIIRSSASSLLLIINDVLDMSKIESGVVELRPEPTDPREICDFLHTVFSEPAAKKNLKLQCHLAEDLPHALLLDRMRLRQILINLVGNAVKFTDQGRIDIRVTWEKQPTSSLIALMIEVQDTGVGIPQDKLDAIFKPFVQSGAHREKEKLGTGLGLSIVKRLTEIMGGKVTVTSIIGQGSAFHLRLPDVPISARLPISALPSVVNEVDFNILHQSTLLVVDDNEINCQLIAEMFGGTHHRLIFAPNGEEAVAKAREIKPSIVLLDVRMPGMGGREALMKIRKLGGLELIPIIAVTASNLKSEEISLKERFSGYVRKPFSKRELFDELSQFLASQPVKKTTKNGAVTARPNVPAPPELISQLQRLIIDPWPSIRDSLAINEIKIFAQGLEGLGERWHCEPLAIYARKLLADAENYALIDLEKHLGEFALLVEELKNESPS